MALLDLLLLLWRAFRLLRRDDFGLAAGGSVASGCAASPPLETGTAPLAGFFAVGAGSSSVVILTLPVKYETENKCRALMKSNWSWLQVFRASSLFISVW